mmetsp:Transcript_43125/g.102639  ORF Transcript_43125/g.102639 Transcript_43125/m.102639 type:complete len:300 (-) Transcript_43125:89-988(-)
MLRQDPPEHQHQQIVPVVPLPDAGGETGSLPAAGEFGGNVADPLRQRCPRYQRAACPGQARQDGRAREDDGGAAAQETCAGARAEDRAGRNAQGGLPRPPQAAPRLRLRLGRRHLRPLLSPRRRLHARDRAVLQRGMQRHAAAARPREPRDVLRLPPGPLPLQLRRDLGSGVTHVPREQVHEGDGVLLLGHHFPWRGLQIDRDTRGDDQAPGDLPGSQSQVRLTRLHHNVQALGDARAHGGGVRDARGRCQAARGGYGEDDRRAEEEDRGAHVIPRDARRYRHEPSYVHPTLAGTPSGC